MMRTAACVLCLVAAPVAAGPFDGLWKPSPTTDCTLVGEEGGALKIENEQFTGVGSTCEMTQPVDVRDMDAILYDMACKSEDVEWSDRALFMRAADSGLIMVWNGYAFKYDACPSDPVVGTVTTAEDIGISDEVD